MNAYSKIFEIIDLNQISHSPLSFSYKLIKFFLNIAINYKKNTNGKINTYYINDDLIDIKLKKYNFIAFKSQDLMNLEELIMMKYYYKNRKNYKSFLDLGASTGLHSIIASKLGFKVTSYEPDRNHFKCLKENCRINNLKNIKIHRKAVYNTNGEITFVKVKNNTTSNHIIGLKKNLYGPTVSEKVKTASANNLFKKNELVKMDIEGAEYVVLKSVNLSYWNNTDCFVSIHNNTVARKIFHFFNKKKINIFSSKINWKKVRKYNDMPIGHHEGMIFITKKNQMN
jgi:FkbM family methyltransferase